MASVRTREVHQPLLRGSESAREVWPVSGLLGPQGEDTLPPLEGGREARGLTDLGARRGAAGAVTGGEDAANAGLPQGALAHPLEAREGPRTSSLPRRPGLACHFRRNQTSALLFETP